jgi:hypothetical protein
MKPLGTLLACVCAALALIGCGSSSSDKAASATPASTQAPASAQDQAASQVCSARDAIQTQVSSLSAGSATKAGVTSALTAISADLQKIKDAQPKLAPGRKQQVQDAATAFGTQLKDIVRQTAAGLSKTDAQTQATNAATSLKAAVKKSLQPIQC